MWGEVNQDEALQVWGEALGLFDASDIKEALALMQAGYKEFPPTLPQFVDLCTDAKRRRMQTAPKLDGPRIPMPDHVRQQLTAFRTGHVRSK